MGETEYKTIMKVLRRSEVEVIYEKPYNSINGDYSVAGVLFPSTLLNFSSILTRSRLACTQCIYSSWNIHLIFDVSPLR